MNAFITGSRAYGTPREDSDIDLVVLTSISDMEKLVSIFCSGEGPDGPSYSETDHPTAVLWIGKLNLLIVTDRGDFDVWVDGTRELKDRALSRRVTRDEAVECFKARREAHRNSYYPGTATTIPEPESEKEFHLPMYEA